MCVQASYGHRSITFSPIPHCAHALLCTSVLICPSKPNITLCAFGTLQCMHIVKHFGDLGLRALEARRAVVVRGEEAGLVLLPRYDHAQMNHHQMHSPTRTWCPIRLSHPILSISTSASIPIFNPPCRDRLRLASMSHHMIRMLHDQTDNVWTLLAQCSRLNVSIRTWLHRNLRLLPLFPSLPIHERAQASQPRAGRTSPSMAKKIHEERSPSFKPQDVGRIDTATCLPAERGPKGAGD